MLLCSPACRVVDAKVHNLREVHEPDGSVSRVGAVMGDLEWMVRRSLIGNMSSGDLDLGTKEPEEIEDPYEVCLENLIGLGSCNSDDARTAALQIELFTWLAVDDSYALSRERAVLELGLLARRLGLEGPLDPPADAVTQNEVAPVLEEILRTVRPILAAEPLAADPGPFAAACAAGAALQLDRDGARRLLAACTALLTRGGFDASELAPLRELHADLQRRCVGFALHEALTDGHRVVRAAAVEACANLGGVGAGKILWRAAQDPSGTVVVKSLELIRANGIPAPAEGEPTDRTGPPVDQWLELLVTYTSNFDGPTSAAACRTLAAVSDAGFESLRWEDWHTWWIERGGASPGSS
ncbi:MAG: HEAT repeat domain-containing protein [Planctomycetota bacterium]|nr:HEAT repeat domain-containing protein [Planctomycetota bacterium]